MNSFELLLAQRLVQNCTTERTFSVMLRACFLGIMISTAVLTLVTGIMHGFEHALLQTMQTLHPDLMIRSTHPLDTHKIAHVLTQEFKNSIIASSPVGHRYALMSDDETDELTLLAIHAIDPEQAAATTALLSTGAPLYALDEKSVIVGSELARHKHLKKGDRIKLAFARPEQTVRNRLCLDEITASIIGTFKTGIDEYDAQGVFVSHQFIEKHFDRSDIYEIGLKLKRATDALKVKSALKDRLHLDVVSWQELYPALIAAQHFEKYGLILILILLLMMASMNIFSLLHMFIEHKRHTFFLLRTFGLSKQAVKRISMIVASGITMLATAVGIGCALLGSYILDHYQLIRLPELYYATHLVAPITLGAVIVVTGCALLLSLGVSWYAASTI